MPVTVGQGALAEVNLIIAQGVDNTYLFRYSKEISGVTAPVNLTGYSARAQIRRSIGGALFLEITDIELGANGTIQIDIPSTVTNTPQWRLWREGVWDLELTDPLGGVVRFASGEVEISPEVTINA